MKKLFLSLFLSLYFIIICNGQEFKKTKFIEKHEGNQIEFFEVLEGNPKIKDGQYFLKIKIGDSIFIKTKGRYVNNFKEGNWIDFYLPDDQINNSLHQIEYLTTYKYGLKDGPFFHLGKVGDTILSIIYENNKKK